MDKLTEIICTEFEMEEEDLENLDKFRKADLESIKKCMIEYAEWCVKEHLSLESDKK